MTFWPTRLNRFKVFEAKAMARIAAIKIAIIRFDGRADSLLRLFVIGFLALITYLKRVHLF